MNDFLQEHPNGVILALDEMGFYFQATLTRVWSPIGETPIVAVHPQREHCFFYGILNLRNGHEIAIRADKQCSEYTANFLMQILMIYTEPILLLLDRASWHKGDVTQLLANCQRVEAIYFPVACPDLNPQEHVWAQAREKISHNHNYRNFDELIDDFENYLNNTPFETNFISKYVPNRLCSS